MDTKELKKIYYGKLAVDPDCKAWEEFEYYNDLARKKWCRFTSSIPHSAWDNCTIRHNPKPKKWQPIEGQYIINSGDNWINIVDEHSQYEVDNFTENGLTRANKEQAEQDSKQIRQFCRFLAWRAENCCYTNAILPALDYVGCFLNKTDYSMLKELIDSGEVEL